MNVEPTGPAYRIETARLVIRCYEPDDTPMLHASIAESVDHLREWMPWAHDEPLEPKERLDFVRMARGSFDNDDNFIYGIFNADESTLIGGTGLHPDRQLEGTLEIGYWIHVDHTENGYATEVTRALTAVGLQLHETKRLEIRCAPDNAPSAAIPKKLGYEREGILRSAGVDTDGEPRDTLVWSMTPDRFDDSPAAGADITAYDVLGQQIPLT